MSSMFDEYLALCEDPRWGGSVRACPPPPRVTARRRRLVVSLATVAVFAVCCAAMARTGRLRRTLIGRSGR